MWEKKYEKKKKTNNRGETCYCKTARLIPQKNHVQSFQEKLYINTVDDLYADGKSNTGNVQMFLLFQMERNEINKLDK